MKEGWANVRGTVDNRVADLIRRLEACKVRLVKWCREAFTNFRKLIEQVKLKLDCYLCLEVAKEDMFSCGRRPRYGLKPTQVFHIKIDDTKYRIKRQRI